MTVQVNFTAALAGGLGIAFVGYCFYFDRQRRSHPDFRRNLIEKRREARSASKAQNSTQYPDLLDEMAVQQFFMKEIALGEQLMGMGDIENGIEHLANAVAVTAHKENLLNMLRTTLPDPIFRLLVERLPAVSQMIYSNYKSRQPAEPKITEIFDTDEPVAELREQTADEPEDKLTEELAIDELLD